MPETGRRLKLGDRAENKLFDASFRLAEAARDFERAAGTRGSAPAAAATLGCATSALESQATGMLLMRSLVLHVFSSSDYGDEERAQELGRLLFAIDQNLRFAAQAADLARRLAADILEVKSAA